MIIATVNVIIIKRSRAARGLGRGTLNGLEEGRHMII